MYYKEILIYWWYPSTNCENRYWCADNLKSDVFYQCVWSSSHVVWFNAVVRWMLWADVGRVHRYEFGKALYVGWGASALTIIGGIMLCCNCASKPAGKSYTSPRTAGQPGTNRVWIQSQTAHEHNSISVCQWCAKQLWLSLIYELFYYQNFSCVSKDLISSINVILCQYSIKHVLINTLFTLMLLKNSLYSNNS